MNSTEEYLDSLLKNVTDGNELQEEISDLTDESEMIPEDIMLEEKPASDEDITLEEKPASDKDIMLEEPASVENINSEEESITDLDLPLADLSFEEDNTLDEQNDKLLMDDDISNLLKSVGGVEDEITETPIDEQTENILDEMLEEPSKETEEESLDDLHFSDQETDTDMESEDKMENDDLDMLEEKASSETDTDRETEESLLDLGISDFGELEDLPSAEAESTDTDTDDQDSLDSELSDLLSGLPEDEELSEINDILNKNDNNEIVESGDEDSAKEQSKEDLFDIEELIGDDENKSEETLGKKKKGKKALKVKKERKPGALSKFFAGLFEEVEEPEEVKQIFAEETATDIAKEGAVANEKILDEMADEDESDTNKKGKKGKKNKEKKPKKEKKIKEKPIDNQTPQKKLPKKKVVLIGVLCFSLGVMMTLVAFVYPYYSDTKNAKSQFQQQNYEKTYELLKGHKLNDEENIMYAKSVVLLKAERKYDSYKNYMMLGMKLEAMNALVQGVKVTEQLAEMAETLDVKAEFDEIRTKIIEELQNSFAVSVEQANAWLQISDNQKYSRELDNYLNGDSSQNDLGDTSSQQNKTENSVIAGEEQEITATGDETSSLETEPQALETQMAPQVDPQVTNEPASADSLNDSQGNNKLLQDVIESQDTQPSETQGGRSSQNAEDLNDALSFDVEGTKGL